MKWLPGSNTENSSGTEAEEQIFRLHLNLNCLSTCVVKLFETFSPGFPHWPNIVKKQFSYKLCHCALFNLCTPKETRGGGGAHPNDGIAWTGRKHKSNLFHWQRKESAPPSPSSSFLFLPCSHPPPPSSNSPTQQLFLSLFALPAPLHAHPPPPTSPSVMALFYCCAAFGRETPVWTGAGVRLPLNAGV